jgi:hypothetical protein
MTGLILTLCQPDALKGHTCRSVEAMRVTPNVSSGEFNVSNPRTVSSRSR